MHTWGKACYGWIYILNHPGGQRDWRKRGQSAAGLHNHPREGWQGPTAGRGGGAPGKVDGKDTWRQTGQQSGQKMEDAEFSAWVTRRTSVLEGRHLADSGTRTHRTPSMATSSDTTNKNSTDKTALISQNKETKVREGCNRLAHSDPGVRAAPRPSRAFHAGLVCDKCALPMQTTFK